MSSREFLIKRVVDVIESDESDTIEEGAETIVDALMPQLTDKKQMLGVPDGSILIVEVQAGARAVRWEDGHLHGNLRADGMPMDPAWVIDRYGPLTVVWMP